MQTRRVFSATEFLSVGYTVPFSTWQPLTAAEDKELREEMRQTFAPKGENLILNIEIDKSLIGGMVVQSSQKGILDLSIKTMVSASSSLITKMMFMRAHCLEHSWKSGARQ